MQLENPPTAENAISSSFHQSRYSLIHLSDPHLSRQYYREHTRTFRSLLRTVLDRGLDHLVITGDIVSTAEEPDYALARDILEGLDVLGGDVLTVVPGNHDVFGGPHRAVDVMSFPRHIRSVDYRHRLELFSSAFAESFDGAYRLCDPSLFPYIKIAGPFVLIALNSIPPWSFWRNPLGTNGFVNDEQIEGLERLAQTNLVKTHIPVAILHHHFNDAVPEDPATPSLWHRIESRTMRLKRRKKILQLFADLNVRFVLHGHIHRNEVYKRGGITIANGAGAVCDDSVEYIKFNELLYSNGCASLTKHVVPIPYTSGSTKPRRGRIKKEKLFLPRFSSSTTPAF